MAKGRPEAALRCFIGGCRLRGWGDRERLPDDRRPRCGVGRHRGVRVPRADLLAPDVERDRDRSARRRQAWCSPRTRGRWPAPRRCSRRSSRHGSPHPSSGRSPDRPSRRSRGRGRRRERRVRAVRERDRLARWAGVVPLWIWIQTSNECVVALPKFFTPSQSTTIQPASGATAESGHADRTCTRARRVEVAPQRSERVVRPGRVREVLRREDDVSTVAAADDDVAVRHDADPRIRLAAVVERRHVEVRDRVVPDARDRPDAEERQREVAAVGSVAGDVAESVHLSVGRRVRACRSSPRRRLPRLIAPGSPTFL